MSNASGGYIVLGIENRKKAPNRGCYKICKKWF